MNADKCGGCGADIFWIKTSEGKAMPVDQTKRRIMTALKWTMDGGTIKEDEWISVVGYQSHFATCPKATEFRKAKP